MALEMIQTSNVTQHLMSIAAGSCQYIYYNDTGDCTLRLEFYWWHKYKCHYRSIHIPRNPLNVFEERIKNGK